MDDYETWSGVTRAVDELAAERSVARPRSSERGRYSKGQEIQKYQFGLIVGWVAAAFFGAYRFAQAMRLLQMFAVVAQLCWMRQAVHVVGNWGRMT